MPELWLSRKLARHAPALLLVLCSYLVSAQNPNAETWGVAYSTNNSIGPDGELPAALRDKKKTKSNPEIVGPWWFISQSVDFPDQFLSVYPSLAQSNLIVSKNVCTSQTADCPLPVQPGWTPSGAYANVNNGSDHQSVPNCAESDFWDLEATKLLDLQGYAFYTQQRFTIHRNGNLDQPGFLDGLCVLVSNNLTVNFPGGAGYTVDVGLVGPPLFP